MLRDVKILLVLLVALWGLIGAAGNFSHLDLVYEQVRGVTVMPTMPPDAAPPWRTEHPVVVWLGVGVIIAGKLAATVFGGAGAAAMIGARRKDAETFQRAKTLALVGGALAVAALFGGFTVIGESLYLMFRDAGHLKAGEGAFRYAGFIALIMIFVAQRD